MARAGAAAAEKLLEKLAEAALAVAPVPSGGRVVDVEAGLGALTMRAARGGAARVDALDASKAIVAALKARVAVARIKNVEARVGDAGALPFPERTFDAGYFSSAGADGAALAELRRVLKAGARAAVAATGAARRDEIIEEMVVAGFDEVQAHAVEGAKAADDAWVVVGIA